MALRLVYDCLASSRWRKSQRIGRLWGSVGRLSVDSDRSVSCSFRLIIGRFRGCLQYVTHRTTLAFRSQQTQFRESLEVPSRSIVDDPERSYTPPPCDRSRFQDLPHDLLLALIELRLNSWRHRELGIRHADTIQIVAWSGKRDLEIAGVGA